MSREALSLDISRVVSRVVSGEPIDTAENGAALAAKYPDLGMSAALISQAIDRAAGMVGMIRSAPEPVKPLRIVPAAVAAPAIVENVAVLNGKTQEAPVAASVAPRATIAAAPAAPPVALQSIDDDLAAAIDAEIGNLISEQRAKPAKVDASASLAAAGENRTAMLAPARSNGNRQTVPAWSEEPGAAAAPLPLLQPSHLEEPAAREPTPGSLLANFRRVIFRS